MIGLLSSAIESETPAAGEASDVYDLASQFLRMVGQLPAPLFFVVALVIVTGLLYLGYRRWVRPSGDEAATSVAATPPPQQAPPSVQVIQQGVMVGRGAPQELIELPDAPSTATAAAGSGVSTDTGANDNDDVRQQVRELTDAFAKLAKSVATIDQHIRRDHWPLLNNLDRRVHELENPPAAFAGSLHPAPAEFECRWVLRLRNKSLTTPTSDVDVSVPWNGASVHLTADGRFDLDPGEHREMPWTLEPNDDTRKFDLSVTWRQEGDVQENVRIPVWVPDDD